MDAPPKAPTTNEEVSTTRNIKSSVYLKESSTAVSVDKIKLTSDVWNKQVNTFPVTYLTMYKEWFIRLAQENSSRETFVKLKKIAPWFKAVVVDNIKLDEFDLLANSSLLWLSPKVSYRRESIFKRDFDIAITSKHVIHCLELEYSLFHKLMAVNERYQGGKLDSDSVERIISCVYGTLNAAEREMCEKALQSTDGCGKIIFTVEV